MVAGAVIGVIHWSRKRAFSALAFAGVFGVLFGVGAVNVLNSWPVFASQATTAQPLGLQIGIIIATSLVLGIFSAAALALIAGLVAASRHATAGVPIGRSIVLGLSIGAALAGAGALARHLAPSTSPLWGNLGPASTFIPFIAAAITPLSSFFTQSLILLVVLYFLDRRPRAAAFWIIVGLALAGSTGIETILSWIIIGAATGVVLLLAYRLVFRHEPQLLLITTAALVMLSTIRDGLQRGYPFALPGSIAAAVLVALVAWIWFRGSMDGLHAGEQRNHIAPLRG